MGLIYKYQTGNKLTSGFSKESADEISEASINAMAKSNKKKPILTRSEYRGSNIDPLNEFQEAENKRQKAEYQKQTDEQFKASINAEREKFYPGHQPTAVKAPQDIFRPEYISNHVAGITTQLLPKYLEKKDSVFKPTTEIRYENSKEAVEYREKLKQLELMQIQKKFNILTKPKNKLS